MLYISFEFCPFDRIAYSGFLALQLVSALCPLQGAESAQPHLPADEHLRPLRPRHLPVGAAQETDPRVMKAPPTSTPRLVSFTYIFSQ